MTTWVKDLLDRRVPQYLGFYIGASWGLVQFVDFLVDRYLLSPHLVDLSMALAAVLLPTICLLSWFHGARGDDEWSRVEKLGIPANLAVGGAVLFFLFGGKDLGAATTTVAVEDEEGNRVERVVPKSEFRKEVALFYFDNETGDPEWDWLSYGIVQALETDLDQDLFVRVSAGMTRDLKENGFDDGRSVPLALKRKTAEEARRRHFLAGTLVSAEGGIEVRTRLYETQSGSLVAERTERTERAEGAEGAEGVLALVDRIAVQLKRDLEVPERHLETAEDLPAAELLTTSPEAFRAFAAGHRALAVEDDWQAAQGHLEAAVAADSTFALAQWFLSDVYWLGNQTPKAMAALQRALDHVYKLPTRYQFRVKHAYYHRHQQPEKVLAVLRMWTEYYPDDTEGHLALANLYRMRDAKEEALREYERVLEIDPTQRQYLQSIGSIYEDMGDYETALGYYRDYGDHFPDDPGPPDNLGDLFVKMGRLDSARAYFEKAHLIDPDAGHYLRHLGDVAARRGDFETAEARLAEALEAARTPQNRIAVFGALREMYERRGQIRRAMEYAEKAAEESRGVAPPFFVLMNRLMALPLRAEIGEEEAAFREIDRVAEGIDPAYGFIVPLVRLELYTRLEDVAGVEENLPAAEEMIESYGIGMVEFAVRFTRAEVHRWRGECEAALPLYEEARALAPNEPEVQYAPARCHRALGDLETAREVLEETLRRIPYEPEALYELALVQEAMGEPERAVETLEKALRVWADADPEYEPARKAREKLETLRTLAAS